MSGPEHFADITARHLFDRMWSAMDQLTEDREWSVELTGNLGFLGQYHEMNGLTEGEARRRFDRWREHRPDVVVVLRWRPRQVVVGTWRQVQS